MKVLLIDDLLTTAPVSHEALSRLDEIHSAPYWGALNALMEAAFDFVIINAVKTEHLSLLVARIHFQKLCPHVLVVTKAPSWRLARDLLRAGADDCIDSDTLPIPWTAILDELLQSRGNRTSDFIKENHEQTFHTLG